MKTNTTANESKYTTFVPDVLDPSKCYNCDRSEGEHLDGKCPAELSEYDTQAETFLARNGLKFRATLSDSKTPAWAKDGEETGHHYRITLSKKPDYTLRDQRGAGYKLPSRRLVFDFWGSIADARENKHPSAYDVLACISGDAYTPETFEDFCAEYGYESDSIKALQQFRRCDRFAKRLRAFFTSDELTQLSEIQ